MSFKVSQITIYPVKSLAGINLSSSKVLSTGLEFDRNWVIVDHKNKFITQRQFPKMATIIPRIEKDCLYLSHGDFAEVKIPIVDHDKTTETVQVWKDECEAHHESTEVDNFLTDILATKEQQRFRLMRMAPSFDRKVGVRYLPEQEASLLFADACPFLITFTSSLKALDEMLDFNMPMDRFRANVVVETSEPWQEYQWHGIKSDAMQFDFIGPCQRCPMTSVDQTTGKVVTPGQPLQTLMEHFSVGDKNLPYFGQHAKLATSDQCDTAPEIRVGDSFERF